MSLSEIMPTGFWMAIGVGLFIAAYYAVMSRRQSKPAMAKAFASLCACLALASFGLGLIASAPDAKSASDGYIVTNIAGILTFAAFLRFLLVILPDEPPIVYQAIDFWVWSGLCLSLSGLFTDPNLAVYSASVPHRIEALLTPWAALHSLGSTLITTVLILRALRRHRVRALVWNFAISFLPSVIMWGAFGMFGKDSPDFLLALSSVTMMSTCVLSIVLIRHIARRERDVLRQQAALDYKASLLAEEQFTLRDEENLATLGSLSAVISHQIRNPLAVLQNSVTMLQRTQLASDHRETLVQILDQEAGQLEALVRDLLTYAQPLRPKPVAVDLGELIQSRLEHFSARLAEQKIQTHCEFGYVPASFMADPHLVAAALDRLILNAIQALEEGGNLYIECAKVDPGAPNAIAIRVIDDGQIYPYAAPSEMIRPFSQVRPGSTGLGLAIAEKIARSHKGSLSASTDAEDRNTSTMELHSL